MVGCSFLFVCTYSCWLVGWLVDCFVGWLVGWLVVWLVGWLVVWLFVKAMVGLPFFYTSRDGLRFMVGLVGCLVYFLVKFFWLVGWLVSETPCSPTMARIRDAHTSLGGGRQSPLPHFRDLGGGGGLKWQILY